MIFRISCGRWGVLPISCELLADFFRHGKESLLVAARFFAMVTRHDGDTGSVSRSSAAVS